MRFSLKWLFSGVAFVAVSLVAMLNANELWRIGFRSAVLFSALVAIIGALWSVGATRAFCGGYAIMALSFVTKFFGAEWGSELITMHGLIPFHSLVAAPIDETLSQNRVIELTQADHDQEISVKQFIADRMAITSIIRPRRQDFLQVGNAVLSIVLGVIGGFIAVAFYRRRPQRAEHNT